jgi:molecular chaperone Hsp33
MPDQLLRAMFDELDIKASVVVCTETARAARAAHSLEPVSAMLLGQWLCAGALMAALQKGDSRINLQLECDGPLRGMFVDASALGPLRGYAKNPYLDLELDEGPQRFRPAFGNTGFISTLRNIGDEEYYRSSVELKHMTLSDDLNHYFTSSEQVPTAVALHQERSGADPLGCVAGVLFQLLPGGNSQKFERFTLSVADRLTQALSGGVTEPFGILQQLANGHDFQPLASTPVSWQCTCSREKVLSMLQSLGKAELAAILTETGEAKVTCQFCGTAQVASADDLRQLLEQIDGMVG